MAKRETFVIGGALEKVGEVKKEAAPVDAPVVQQADAFPAPTDAELFALEEAASNARETPAAKKNKK